MNDVMFHTKDPIGTGGSDALYERDFLLWTEEQARLLRVRQLEQLDLDHLIEEIEDMGNHLRRELKHRLEVLQMHLLKCQYQPAHKSASWLGTLYEQRSEIQRLLEDCPSLKPKVVEYSEVSYPMARKRAAAETGLPRTLFPVKNPYSKEQMLDEEFVP